MSGGLRHEIDAFEKAERERSDAALREGIAAALDLALPSWRKDRDLADALVNALACTAKDYHFRELGVRRAGQAHDNGCREETVRAIMVEVAAEYPPEGPLGGERPITSLNAVRWAKVEADQRRRDAAFQRKMKSRTKREVAQW